ncbi:dipeptidase PepV [Caldibacillus thermolactis]|jgi:succinyl-diaminopimelate desuccinylase|uniref:Dipeptidase PepV n=1 Tax=Pallidibacillus thermolactis TaxID=251051 RepID=A0ABT2WET2_9BACI|nr:dipeptidase PepV [Pallidibacillus thermolactis]MCU9594204.1 dipeptidase PepV [Pallidibacillus thermolactis]
MTEIQWMDEVLKRKDDFIKDLQSLLQIKSVLDEENATEDAPLGPGIKEALQFLLDLGEKDGFKTKNVDNFAGHLEMGAGSELVGVLGHIDVVPEGDGWSVDPYSGVIKDGKIYARGASDDKGPTMAAYYAMKIVKELGLPLKKRVRLIIGTDEESDWRCVEHYFKHEEMPTLGFVPDADFPIIFAEKGISDYDIVQKPEASDTDATIQLLSFQSGRRYNMVPDFAEARLVVHIEPQEIIEQYHAYLENKGLEGSATRQGDELVLTLVGISAHGAEPRNGKNAGIFLAQFLKELQLDKEGKKYVKTVAQFYNHDRGELFDIVYEDEDSGELTINVGVMRYTKDEGGRIGCNMRYPVTFHIDLGKSKIEAKLKEAGLHLENFTDSKPTYVKKNDPLIQTLQKVYEEQTGENAELLAIGGGTYARALDHGVAFGALFPGREDVMHQKDEYAYLDDLLKATAIYAQAIYELAK